MSDYDKAFAEGRRRGLSEAAAYHYRWAIRAGRWSRKQETPTAEFMLRLEAREALGRARDIRALAEQEEPRDA